MVKGLGNATIGLFGSILALEVGYATYVAKLREMAMGQQTLKGVEHTVSVTERDKADGQDAKRVDSAKKNYPLEDSASNKTVYSTQMDGGSKSVHISIVIDAPKATKVQNTTTRKVCNRRVVDAENKKPFVPPDEPVKLRELSDAVEQQVTSPPKMRDILIDSGNLKADEACRKVTKEKHGFLDDVEPYRGHGQINIKNLNEFKENQTSDQVENAGTRFTSPIVLQNNQSENIEVIPVSSSFNFNNWDSATPHLRP